MPASAFSGTDDYLRINVAEREGLITVINEVSLNKRAPVSKNNSIPDSTAAQSHVEALSSLASDCPGQGARATVCAAHAGFLRE